MRPDIIEIDEFNIQEEVIDFSISSIVMMMFWAPWSKESLRTKKSLEDMMDHIAGPVRLALVNIETSPVITSQFAVFSVPSVKFVFQGQIENTIIGPHAVSAYISALRRINAVDPLMLTLEKAEASLEAKEAVEAESLFQNYLTDRPNHPRARFGLSIAYLNQRRWVDAYELLKDFPPSAHYYEAAEKVLPLAGMLRDFEADRISFDETSGEDRQFRSALRFFTQDKKELGIESLLELLKINRDYRNGIGKKLVVAALETYPENEPLRDSYRAELAKILF